jgi:hypothetical protein
MPDIMKLLYDKIFFGIAVSKFLIVWLAINDSPLAILASW